MHVFLFDIDGTLIQSGGAGKSALHDALREQFQIEQPTEVAIHGCTDRSIARDLFAHHGIEDTTQNWQRFRDAYLQRLPRWLVEKQGSVLPGVESWLAQLAPRTDSVVGLLTGNVAEGARIKLKHFALDHHFKFGGYGDEHHIRDDVAREAFRAAHHSTGNSLRADHTYVIGDTPNDVRCARAIGARAVAVATGFFAYDELAAESPDWLLRDLSDLAPLLQLLDDAP